MARGKSVDTARVQLGPFWLWYRAQRDEWCICWYDDGGGSGNRRTRRLSTGIQGGGDGRPPREAEDALAAHYLASQQPVERPIAATYVEDLMATWLLDHAQVKLADPTRYANGVAHWQAFFAHERRGGRLTAAPTVADINSALVERFHQWRSAQGVSPATVSRDTAALRQPLNWAWKKNLIPSAPFVPDPVDKPQPKSLVYTPEQVAALLEAAWAIEERRHIHLFAMIMLSTHGRGEAILELDRDQVQGGLIYFNAPDRKQTKKRRSIVPIAPTLAPWLEDLPLGRVIQWQRRRIDEGGETVFDRYPVDSIKTGFEKCLIASGIVEHELDQDGEPAWLPPRRKLGETAPRPHLVGLGSPNVLRHTVSTEMHMRGVPEAQIDAAAGHSGDSTNKRHYRHLRPDYLRDFIAGVEDYWSEVGRFTKVHLRYQRGTKRVDMAKPRATRLVTNG